MIFSPEITEAVRQAFATDAPLALCRAPGAEPVLVSDFEVSPWPGQPDITPEVWRQSTPREDYYASIASLAATLRAEGGKAVISRAICGCNPALDWLEVASRLFERYPDAFCHLYHSPRSGWWLGATPEILLRHDADGRFVTMALAGTRRDSLPWDAKNIEEHNMVRDFIADTLSEAGVEFGMSPGDEIAYGSIRHRCTMFSGTMPDAATAARIVDNLNPTPAVGGWPRRRAMEHIGAIEAHPRKDYGGYINYSTGGTRSWYVNLRCVNFDLRGNYCIYAGGGITGLSVPADEWAETEAKAAVLLELTGHNRSDL